MRYILLFLTFLCSSISADLIPYFSYSNHDLQLLQSEETQLSFTQEELKKWDHYIDEVFKEAPSSFVKQRLLTYLYVAQNEAAALSYQVRGYFAGSLDPLSW